VLEPFLAENVAKEARKDALVIRRAGAAEAAGTPADARAVRELLAAARAIDRDFLDRIAGAPVRIAIRYERLEPLRQRRIELGLDTAYRILQGWRHGRRVREVLEPAELERRLAGILRLYAEETAALGESVRLPRLLAPLRERIVQRLGQAMTQAAATIARNVSGKRARRAGHHSPA
jgi:hypothetical protein